METKYEYQNYRHIMETKYLLSSTSITLVLSIWNFYMAVSVDVVHATSSSVGLGNEHFTAFTRIPQVEVQPVTSGSLLWRNRAARPRQACLGRGSNSGPPVYTRRALYQRACQKDYSESLRCLVILQSIAFLKKCHLREPRTFSFQAKNQYLCTVQYSAITSVKIDRSHRALQYCIQEIALHYYIQLQMFQDPQVPLSSLMYYDYRNQETWWQAPHSELLNLSRARIFKHLWSPGIDSKEPIPPGCVAWRAGTITLFLLGSQPPQIV